MRANLRTSCGLSILKVKAADQLWTLVDCTREPRMGATVRLCAVKSISVKGPHYVSVARRLNLSTFVACLANALKSLSYLAGGWAPM